MAASTSNKAKQVSKTRDRDSRRFNGNFHAAVPGSQLSDFCISEWFGNHTHDFMVSFTAAVILQLLAEVDGLLASEVGGTGHAGNAVDAMA